MDHKSLGFIGGGRIVRIFLEGWRRAGKMPGRIVVHDCNPEALAKLKSQFPSVEAANDKALAAAQDIVFLAVHPPIMVETASSLKGILKATTIVISLAPKFTIAKLGESLGGGFSNVARVIPNAPSLCNLGYNPVAFSAGMSSADRKSVLNLLEPLGDCPEVPEEKLEGYALLSAMGPTYLWFQIQALREVATGFGLTPEDIDPALKKTVCGGTRTLLESGLSPAEVVDLIPVKPLVEMEQQVREFYRTKLPALYEKIKP